MANRAAISGSCSVFALTTSQRPWPVKATFSTSGAIILHGPHQGAQKSTTIGSADFPTTASNSAAPLASIGLEGRTSSERHSLHRKLRPRCSKTSRLRRPHRGQEQTRPRASSSKPVKMALIRHRRRGSKGFQLLSPLLGGQRCLSGGRWSGQPPRTRLDSTGK